MQYVIAALLLIIVLSLPTGRNILLGLFSIAVVLVISFLALLIAVGFGFALYFAPGWIFGEKVSWVGALLVFFYVGLIWELLKDAWESIRSAVRRELQSRSPPSSPDF